MNHIEQFRELTAREREVLDLYCQGLPYREIGERLFISVKGVKSHMAHIYQKLGLMHLPPRARAFALREDYWPLVQSEPQSSQETEAEPEIISPILPEVEEMIDQDEDTMKALAVTNPPQPPVRPRRRFRLSCFSIALILLVIGALAFWYFDGLTLVQGVLAGQNAPQSVALNTSIPVGAANNRQSPSSPPTATPSKLPFATSASTETIIPSPTRTQTPRPSPTYNFGPIYELGEWHKEGDLWFRLFDYSVDWEGVYFLVEMWNQSSQTVYFHWETVQNTFLRDNQGNRYEVDSRFEFKDDDEIVPANAKMFIGAAPYDDQWTNWFDPDNLFLPGVTDLYFTLEYFSDIEKVTWHISVGN